MKTIVTLTMNPALDIATRVEKLIADHKLRCHSASQDPGGGGINVARALLRLGGLAIALYPCGGKTGERLQELLAQENVPQRPIPIAQPIREDFLVHENTSGHDYRFVLPGPTLHEAEWRHCLAQLAELATQADYIVASGSLPQGVPVDFYAQVARLAKAQETRLILDTSGAALRAALDEGIYLLRTNFQEFQELIGESMETDANQEAATTRFVAQGQAQVVILTLGAEGALLTHQEGHERVHPPKVDIVSPRGAGDSFVAALTLQLARGTSLSKALRYGVAGAAAALLTPGTELLRREDTQRLYQQISH